MFANLSQKKPWPTQRKMKKFERKIPSKHKKEKEKLVKVEKISKLLQQSSLSLSLSQRPELFLSLHLVHLSSSCTSGHNAGKGRAKVGRLSRSVARPSARVASSAALQIHTYIYTYIALHCTPKSSRASRRPPPWYIYIYMAIRPLKSGACTLYTCITPDRPVQCDARGF